MPRSQMPLWGRPSCPVVLESEAPALVIAAGTGVRRAGGQRNCLRSRKSIGRWGTTPASFQLFPTSPQQLRPCGGHPMPLCWADCDLVARVPPLRRPKLAADLPSDPSRAELAHFPRAGPKVLRGQSRERAHGGCGMTRNIVATAGSVPHHGYSAPPLGRGGACGDCCAAPSTPMLHGTQAQWRRGEPVGQRCQRR
jgi:hypothetical protein